MLRSGLNGHLIVVGVRNEWEMRKLSHGVLTIVLGREGELIYLERCIELETVV